MFCALLTSRYQVSVYRTNGPLVSVYALIRLFSIIDSYSTPFEDRRYLPFMAFSWTLLYYEDKLNFMCWMLRSIYRSSVLIYILRNKSPIL